MDLKSRIRGLCGEHGISVARLEKDLGFANAYISQVNPETIQYSRLRKIAEYFNVSIDYLMTGEESTGYYLNDETAEIAREIYKNPELRALFDASRGSSPKDVSMVKDILLRMKATNPDG